MIYSEFEDRTRRNAFGYVVRDSAFPGNPRPEAFGSNVGFAIVMCALGPILDTRPNSRPLM